jgi:hypothetical protein
MSRLPACAVLIAALFTPAVAVAQEVQAIPPGEDKIVAIREGDKAPFSGQLFDGPTSLRWANWLGQYKLRLRADVDYQRKVDQADITLAQTLLQIERDKYKAVTEDYQIRIGQQQARIESLESAARNPPWYSTPWFGVVVGVAGTTLAVGLGAFALHAAR